MLFYCRLTMRLSFTHFLCGCWILYKVLGAVIGLSHYTTHGDTLSTHITTVKIGKLNIMVFVFLEPIRQTTMASYRRL